MHVITDNIFMLRKNNKKTANMFSIYSVLYNSNKILLGIEIGLFRTLFKVICIKRSRLEILLKHHS